MNEFLNSVCDSTATLTSHRNRSSSCTILFLCMEFWRLAPCICTEKPIIHLLDYLKISSVDNICENMSCWINWDTHFPSILLLFKWSNFSCDHIRCTTWHMSVWCTSLSSRVNVNIILTKVNVPLGWIFISLLHATCYMQYTVHYYILFTAVKETVILKVVKMQWRIFVSVKFYHSGSECSDDACQWSSFTTLLPTPKYKIMYFVAVVIILLFPYNVYGGVRANKTDMLTSLHKCKQILSNNSVL